jgi:hypothetical protein
VILAFHNEAMSTPKPIPNNGLQIATRIDLLKVRTFIESVAMGCINSKNFYEVGLKDKSPVTVLWTVEVIKLLTH